MIDRIAALCRRYRELIAYVIVGAMTTGVYFLTYAIFKYLGVHYEINTCLSWVAAVCFAFVTNKHIVFRSKDRNKTAGEFIKFVGARVATLLIDLFFTFFLIEVLDISEWITKVAVQFIILVLNYVFSKVFVFSSVRKKNKKDEL